MLRHPEVHIHVCAIHLMLTYGCMAPMGINNMHAVHMVLKIVHIYMYVWL